MKHRFGLIMRAELISFHHPNSFIEIPETYKNFCFAAEKIKKLKTPSIEELEVRSLSYYSVGEDLYGRGYGYTTGDVLITGLTELGRNAFMDVIEASIRAEISSATEEDIASGTHLASFGGLRLYHLNKEEYVKFYEREMPFPTEAYRKAAEQEAARSQGGYTSDESEEEEQTSGGLDF